MFQFMKKKLWKQESAVESFFQEHCKLIYAALNAFSDMMDAYLANNKIFKDHAFNIHKKEHEADLVRRDIQLKIYGGAFLPAYREDYILLADLLDNICDKTEATADFITLTRPPVPEFLHEDLRAITNLTIEAFEPLADLVTHFQTNWDKVSLVSEKVRNNESKVDELQWRMTNQLFKSALDLSTKLLLKTMIDDVSVISNRIEDTVDRIEIMVVKRKV
ncbi:TIGR00153 family protein [bacterium]|nr:TIGR00153 family protein [candidate division CSSED10-310 bacterium]